MRPVVAGRRILPKLTVLAIAAGGALLCSCSLSQQLVLDPEGSGSADVQVSLKPMFVAYLQDLEQSVGGSGAIFDTRGMADTFRQFGGVTGVSVESPSPDRLNIHLEFADITQFFPSRLAGGVPPPVTFVSAGGVSTLRFYLSRDNFARIAELPPFRGNQILMTLSPQEATHDTEKDYLDLLSYAFGDYAQGASVADVVKASKVRIALTVRGRIVSHVGGVQQGNTVVFSVPLLAALVLDRPLDFSVTFGP